jgi:THO complex subunit 1
VNIWDLLDIVSILSDDELCDPALGFWLVEELLDSQTIAGCRKVFDYLESRRERMTAKHFKQKELVILRSCKELLRRLSRAEDTAFCGRVYVFMFQSFPLGDKSSVNLRGEYHVENVTTFDVLPEKTQSSGEPMEVDIESKAPPATPEIESKTIPAGPAGLSKPNEDSKSATKSVSFDAKESSNAEKPLDPDALYPIFWSLQQSFSQPKKLFDQSNLAEFKKGLEATMVMFKSVQNEQTGRNTSKSIDEGKRGIKRKRGQRGDDLATTFNPKYLTSRDLFELEVSPSFHCTDCQRYANLTQQID